MPEEVKLGRVTAVRSKNGETYVDVELGPTRTEDRIKFASIAQGFHLPPKEGQMVEVYETERGSFARFCHSPVDFQLPDLKEDSFVFAFGDNTKILFSNDGNGNYTVELRGNDSVLVESQGDATVKGADSVSVESGTQVTLEGGDITIDGTTINLGDGSKQVITDIETSTNSDGAVTDVTPVYSDKVNIE